MAEKNVHPIVKLVIELVPIVVFFVAYGRMKGQTFHVAGNDYNAFILLTAAFIPMMLISTGLLWWLTGKLSKMQIATLVLVVVMGGLSVWFNDERFFKMKPTIIYLLFGGALGVGLLQGKSYLKLVIEEVLPLKEEGWMILTRRICLFFFGLAIANEIVWRTMSTEAWITFKTFVLTAALFVFFISQGKLMEKYGVAEKPDEP